MLITTAFLALFAAAIAAVSSLAADWMLYLLFAIAFLAGCARAFANPAATALQAQVVPRAQTVRGIAILSSVARTADVTGPVVVTFIWAALDRSGTYACLAALFALACLPLLFGVSEQPVDNYRAGGAQLGAWWRIVDGGRHVFSDQILAGSMALDLFAVFFGGATALLPIFAADILEVGPVGFGFLRSAAAAGTLIAAMSAGKLLPQHRAGAVLHWTIAGFALSMIVFGLSRNLYLSLLALFAAGVCDGISVVIRHSLTRLASPEAMRGRIWAVRQVFVGSSNELGALESGLAANLLGAAAATWLGGVITLAVVGIVAWRAPVLRRLDMNELARTPDLGVTKKLKLATAD